MRTTFSEKENINSGLALVLLLLIIALGLKIFILFKILIVLVLLLMIKPAIAYPFTFLWLNFSGFLGKISSKILLALIYFIIVCPTAFVRKLRGKDSLQLKQFKKSGESVFTERNHKYSNDDLIHPY